MKLPSSRFGHSYFTSVFKQVYFLCSLLFDHLSLLFHSFPSHLLPFHLLLPASAPLLPALILTPLCLLQTIRAVQPDVVVVELCQYRVSMLKMDERTLLKEAKDINLEKVQQAIKQVRCTRNRSGVYLYAQPCSA